MSSGHVDVQDIVCAESLTTLGLSGRSDEDHPEASEDYGTVFAEAAARSIAIATSLLGDNVEEQREEQEASTECIFPPSEEAKSASHHSETAPKISKSTKQVIHNLIVEIMT